MFSNISTISGLNSPLKSTFSGDSYSPKLGLSSFVSFPKLGISSNSSNSFNSVSEFKSDTSTSTEFSYLCNIAEYQFNGTSNPSVVVGRSGSITIPENARYSYNGKFDGDAQYENTKDLVLPAGSGSYGIFYNPGTEYRTFTTHSEFGTYVTNIGLYNDTNELLAIAKISNPIKNDKDLPLSFLIRFDS